MNNIKGSVPVKVAARIYGKDTSWVRSGIIQGWLPIGTATLHGKQLTSVSHSGRANFYISPKLLKEHTGYEWEGEKE